jgi:uncharacterized protein (DUF427 family)
MAEAAKLGKVRAAAAVGDYPQAIVPVDHLERAPRRVRATLEGQVVFDTLHAVYLWEWAFYPQYYIPLADVDPALLVDEQHPQRDHRGELDLYGLAVGAVTRPSAVRAYRDSTIEGLSGMARFEWSALDRWFEEDEEIFVHPRSPYNRVDALRSTRRVRVELDGVVLAESSSPIMVFETGLPTRYYLNRTEVDFSHLVPSDTVTSCPYKGKTTGYWSAQIGDKVEPDLAWTYDFPTLTLTPIANLIAFYNEKVDIFVDGALLPRPRTHFS